MDERHAALARLYAAQAWRVRLYVHLRLALGLLRAEVFDALLPRRGTVVDFGCGYGLLANYLALAAPDRCVLGIDADPARLRVASATVDGRMNVEFRCADAGAAALHPLSGAVMTDFLHHLARPAQGRVLAATAAALEPGGVLLIREVNPAHRPRWKYWASVAAEVAMYPDPRTTKLVNRQPDDLVAELRSLGLAAAMRSADQRSPFAGVLYVCERR